MLAGLGAWICLLDGMVVVAGPLCVVCWPCYVLLDYDMHVFEFMLLRCILDHSIWLYYEHVP